MRLITGPQINFVKSLVLPHLATFGCATANDFVAQVNLPSLTMDQARALIDQLKAMPIPGLPAIVKESGRYGVNNRVGQCWGCQQVVNEEAGFYFQVDGRWAVHHKDGECPAPEDRPADPVGIDISSLPNGVYAYEPTRLKVQIKHGTGKWAGTIFVNDAAIYGWQGRLGRQEPGKLYIGKAMDAIAAIVADPKAAMAAYGHLTGRCGKCGRELEDQESIARGIGPVCAKKAGW